MERKKHTHSGGPSRMHRGLFFISTRGALIVLAVLFVAGGIYLALLIRSLPSPDQFNAREVNQSTRLYDRTGATLLYEIHGEEKRTVIPFEGIPLSTKQAVLAAEDAQFYSEPAFDWRGIARAFIANLRAGMVTQGGSTITQQLVKNVFLTPERTITRKLKELILAVELETRYTKDQIFGFYLNQIPFGSNAYGIEAASKTYFGTSTAELSLAESATLAALIQRPSYYSPWGTHLKELADRRTYVLDRMVSLGFISSSTASEAKAEEVKFLPPSIGSIVAPHFVLAVKEYLVNRYSEGFVSNGGLKVITTLDIRLQDIAERAVAEGTEKNAERYGANNAALVAEDPKTGQVLALVGSKDYFGEPEPKGCVPGDTCKFEGNFNVATQGLRQPGSALKPYVYMTAFQKGYSPDTVIYDVSTEFDTRNDPRTSYRPVNFDGLNHGPVHMKNALAQSLNIPAVKTLYLAGFDDVLKNLHVFGITSLQERWRYGLSLTLGGGEVLLTDLTNAYATMSQEGIHHGQTMVLRVEDANETVLEEYHDSSERVIEAQYPRLITSILSDPVLREPIFGSTNALTLFPNHVVALKTGTSEDHRDAWTIGYTPSLVVGVWAGNNNNAAMIRQGSSILAAVPIWHDFLAEALPLFPSGEAFTGPDPVPLPVKPMLNGQAEAAPVVNGVALPQIHSILYYVNRADPLGPIPDDPGSDSQFRNWETGVLAWAAARVYGFSSLYNHPLPGQVDYSTPGIGGTGATGSGTSFSPGELSVSNIIPKNGGFVSTPFSIEATIRAADGTKRIELYWNRRLVNAFDITEYQYRYSYHIEGPIDPQNLFELKVTDTKGRTVTESLLLYH